MTQKLRRKKVLLDSILPLNGSGAIGRQTARSLRASHPELAFVIGGRSLAKSDKAAADIGDAQGVVLDPTSDDLGLGDRPLSLKKS